jgi:hypothetical protein
MSAWDHVTDAVERQGFPREEQPDGVLPDFPTDITAMQSEDINRLSAEYMVWQEYAAARVSEARTREDECEDRLDEQLATATASVQGEKTVAGRKAAAAAHPDVRDAKTELRNAVALRRRYEDIAKNIEWRRTLLSREITRRKDTQPLDSRDARWRP